MANICDSTFRITGDPAELDALRDLMLSLKDEHSADGSSYWVGHIVKALNNNIIPDGLYVRGWWNSVEREDNCLCFQLESAWSPLTKAWDFICSKYETLNAYFVAEERGCEIYVNRPNDEFGWFEDNFYLDACTPDEDDYIQEYFKTLDDALHFINMEINSTVNSLEDVEELNEVWQNENDEAYIYLHEFVQE